MPAAEGRRVACAAGRQRRQGLTRRGSQGTCSPVVPVLLIQSSGFSLENRSSFSFSVFVSTALSKPACAEPRGIARVNIAATCGLWAAVCCALVRQCVLVLLPSRAAASIQAGRAQAARSHTNRVRLLTCSPAAPRGLREGLRTRSCLISLLFSPRSREVCGSASLALFPPRVPASPALRLPSSNALPVSAAAVGRPGGVSRHTNLPHKIDEERLPHGGVRKKDGLDATIQRPSGGPSGAVPSQMAQA